MEQNSGVKFQQAMVALARQWVGADNTTSQPENVTIVLPDETKGSTATVEGNWTRLLTCRLTSLKWYARRLLRSFIYQVR